MVLAGETVLEVFLIPGSQIRVLSSAKGRSHDHVFEPKRTFKRRLGIRVNSQPVRRSLAILRSFPSELAKADRFAVALFPALYVSRNEEANRVAGFRNGLESGRRYTTGKSGCDL